MRGSHSRPQPEVVGSRSPASGRSQSHRSRDREASADTAPTAGAAQLAQVHELEEALHDTRLSWIEQQERGRMFAALTIARVSDHRLIINHV